MRRKTRKPETKDAKRESGRVRVKIDIEQLKYISFHFIFILLVYWNVSSFQFCVFFSSFLQRSFRSVFVWLFSLLKGAELTIFVVAKSHINFTMKCWFDWINRQIKNHKMSINLKLICFSFFSFSFFKFK